MSHLLALVVTSFVLAVSARAQSCAYERVSTDLLGNDTDSGSGASVLSADGSIVVFQSGATNLVPIDTNGFDDLFALDRTSHTLTRISVSSAGAEANGSSNYPTISADGRYVCFTSSAGSLVAGDTNNAADVFVHDRVLQTTERVSVATSGAQGNGASFIGQISANGRFVVFSSFASNLVPGDLNFQRDVFLRDLVLGITERISVDDQGVESNGLSGGSAGSPHVTDDGRYVVFASAASNLVAGDTNGRSDVFLRDRADQTTHLITAGPGGAPTDGDSNVYGMTPDGSVVCFTSEATNLIVGDTNDVGDGFVWTRATQSFERVSVGATGSQGDLDTWQSAMSADGRFVLFLSNATDLVPNDFNGKRDLFLRDRWLETTERVSLDAQSGSELTQDSSFPALSPNGAVFSFATSALVAGVDGNNASDVFLRACSWPETFCYGTPSACPCGNGNDTPRGCWNSSGVGGLLIASGESGVTLDTAVLYATGLPQGQSSLAFQGTTRLNGGNGVAFGDGLRCVGGTIVRLGTRAATGGVARFGFGVPGDLPISVRGGVQLPGGVRNYQVWYRNVTNFCTSSPFNMSNAVELLWTP